MTLLRSIPLSGVLLLVAFAAGCGDSPTEPDFDASLGIDLAAMNESATGLYWQDLIVGDGAEAVAGKTAKLSYKGWLPNGTLFDSGSFSYVVSSGQVIPGFDEGVRGMKVGGKRKLVIPPNLGYGNQAVGSIPKNSTLVFEVSLEGVS